MTGTLALIGGDPFDAACTFNAPLVTDAGADEVIVVPTAAAYEHPDRLVAAATAHFEGVGIAVRSLDVLTRADAMDPTNARALADVSVVYLVGSSAMHARPTLLGTPVWDALVAAFRNGATIVGSDAGAQILGDPMFDSRGGAFTVGLGLIERFSSVPRWNTLSDDVRQRLHQMTNADLAVLGIDEATAAIRSPERTWRSAGSGSVHAFIGGDPIDLADLDR